MDKWLSTIIIIVMIFVAAAGGRGDVWMGWECNRVCVTERTIYSCARNGPIWCYENQPTLYLSLTKKMHKKFFSNSTTPAFFSLLPRFSKRISYARTLKQEHLQTQYSIRNQIGYCLYMMCKLLCRQILSFKIPCVELSKSHTSQLPTQDKITICCLYGAGRNDFDAEKSISRSIGKGWAQKSTIFWALKWQRAKSTAI
jgi:hypothetical protein